MKSYALFTGLLLLTSLRLVADQISFPECPAVDLDTSGCEILITVTATNGSGVATAFTVTTSSPDLGSYDGGDGTLIGVLNSSSGGVFSLNFTIAPGTGTLDFDGNGACKGTGAPPADIYSPGPTAAQCLQGQYWTTDAMDYASADVTFTSFNLADFGIIMSGAAGPLAPGQSTWFSLPGDITASEITAVAPEPASLVLIGIGLYALCFVRRRKTSVTRTINR